MRCTLPAASRKDITPTLYVLSDPHHFGLDWHLISEVRQTEVVRDLEMVKELKIPLFVPIGSENLFSKNVSDPTRTRGYRSLTAYKALSIACYLGYSKIFICGIDNDYFKNVHVDRDNAYYSDKITSISGATRASRREEKWTASYSRSFCLM